jgi:CRP/FNR family transcriptional regulator, anaerobic regulatory protein
MDKSSDVIKALLKIYQFSDDELVAINAKLITKKIAKKSFLLKPPQKCSYLTYIVKGSFRLYALNDIVETTMHFFTEGNWVADNESLISQKPTNHYLQAMEDSEIQIISMEDIHALMDQDSVFRNLWSILNHFIIPTSHYISTYKSSPDSRYQKLLEEHPEWVNRFPQMHIASYLGMTKETFSRVRSRLR